MNNENKANITLTAEEVNIIREPLHEAKWHEPRGWKFADVLDAFNRKVSKEAS